jgi:hypothetical protein
MINIEVNRRGNRAFPDGKISGDQVDWRSISLDYPEISPFYLRIHISLIQILYTSEADEAIDQIFREWE